MKRTTKSTEVSIVPVWEESRKTFATDALPVIWWSKPRGGTGRRSSTARNSDLTKAVDSVRKHIGTLEAKVSELKRVAF